MASILSQECYQTTNTDCAKQIDSEVLSEFYKRLSGTDIKPTISNKPIGEEVKRKMANNLQKKYLDPGLLALLKLDHMDNNLSWNSSGIRMICDFVFNANKEAITKIALEELEERKKEDEDDDC